MLFNEIYSVYYNELEVLIDRAIDGELNYGNACEFIKTEAFRDSFVYIQDAIQCEQLNLSILKRFARMLGILLLVDGLICFHN